MYMYRLIVIAGLMVCNQAYAANICKRSAVILEALLTAMKAKDCKSISYVKLASVTELELSLTELKERDLDHLFGLKSLTITTPEKKLPNDLFIHLQQLESLSLTAENLEDFEARDLFPLESLKSLELFVNKLKNLKKDTFSGLKKLDTLTLHAPGLEAMEDGSLQPLKALRSIVLNAKTLKTLGTDPFPAEAPLMNVKIMNLELKNFPCEAFQNLAKLSELELLYSSIDHIPDHCFSNLKGLKLLSLTGNKITQLSADTFKGLTDLIVLDLSRNLITDISEESLSPLKNLETLNMGGNQLSTLRQGSFVHLSALKELNVLDNPFKVLEDRWHEGLLNIRTITFGFQFSKNNFADFSPRQRSFLSDYSNFLEDQVGLSPQDNIAYFLMMRRPPPFQLTETCETMQEVLVYSYTTLDFATLAHYDLLPDGMDTPLLNKYQENISSITNAQKWTQKLFSFPHTSQIQKLQNLKEVFERASHPLTQNIDEAIIDLKTILKQTYDYRRHKNSLDPELQKIVDPFFNGDTPRSLSSIADLSLSLFDFIKAHESDQNWNKQYLLPTLHLKSYLKLEFRQAFPGLRKQDEATLSALITMSKSYDLLSEENLGELEAMAAAGVELRERLTKALEWQSDKVKKDFSFEDENASDLLPSLSTKIVNILMADSILAEWQAHVQ